jgi:hypothetical protein
VITDPNAPSEPRAGRPSVGQPHPVRQPRLLAFNLRFLLYFFALAAATLALLANVSNDWRLLMGTALALIGAHVLGTKLGTRLRDSSNEIQHWKTAGPHGLADDPRALPQPVRIEELDLPATTVLSLSHPGHARGRLPTIVGATLGMTAGLIAIVCLAGPRVSWAGRALGSVSCGVLGGWVALVAVNFYSIARHAIRQASQEE